MKHIAFCDLIVGDFFTSRENSSSCLRSFVVCKKEELQLSFVTTSRAWHDGKWVPTVVEGSSIWHYDVVDFRHLSLDELLTHECEEVREIGLKQLEVSC